jgi:hypothetical protein
MADTLITAEARFLFGPQPIQSKPLNFSVDK